MPKGRPLSKETRERIYDLYTMGVPQSDIAEQFDIHSNTVSRIVSTQRKLREGKRVEKVSEVVVAGDKRNGRLLSVGTNKYEGTCLIGGRMKRRSFSAINSRNAKVQWEKWCTTLRDEQSFIDMVERTPRHEADEHDVTEPKAVCGYPGDPIEEIRPIVEEPVDITPAPIPEISVRPWKEVAEERQKEINRLLARINELESTRGQQSDSMGPSYAIWAKSDEPRFYGLYSTMDKALGEVDRLNDVAKFLGQDGVFEVEEVAWRG